jgi:hypothetical protein
MQKLNCATWRFGVHSLAVFWALLAHSWRGTKVLSSVGFRFADQTHRFSAGQLAREIRGFLGIASFR